jgi:hypothetical protein
MEHTWQDFVFVIQNGKKHQEKSYCPPSFLFDKPFTSLQASDSSLNTSATLP